MKMLDNMVKIRVMTLRSPQTNKSAQKSDDSILNSVIMSLTSVSSSSISKYDSSATIAVYKPKSKPLTIKTLDVNQKEDLQVLL